MRALWRLMGRHKRWYAVGSTLDHAVIGCWRCGQIRVVPAFELTSTTLPDLDVAGRSSTTKGGRGERTRPPS